MVGVLLLVSCGYFQQGGGWNQNIRLDVARAVTEHGTLHIDDLAANTGDRAAFNGHLFSDKPPGQPLVSLPAVALIRPLLAALHVDDDSEPGTDAMGWAATIFSSGLPAAAAAVLLFWICLSLGSSTTAAAVSALAFGLATPTWAYATLLWAHSLATACLLAAFAAGVALSHQPRGRRGAVMTAGLGLACGWAVITDFPVAPAAAIIAVTALMGVHREQRPRSIGLFAAGSAVPVAILLANNAMSFGSPFRVGYAAEVGFEGLHHGFMGVTWPHLDVLVSLLVGPARGILLIAPVLIVAPVGLIVLARRTDARPFAIAAGAVAVYFVLYNSAYEYWSGGWSFGPRHLASGIPFVCIGLASLWDLGRARLRAVLVGLSVVGVIICLAAVTTTPQPTDDYPSPISDLIVPAIRHGQVALGSQSYLEVQPNPPVTWRRTGGDATNVGLLLGLPGLWSLLPLAVVWAILGRGLRRQLCAEPPEHPSRDVDGPVSRRRAARA